MSIYRIEAQAAVTLYVRARNKAEALRLAHDTRGGCAFADASDQGVAFSGLQFDDPDLPIISLSPALTITGVDDTAERT